jgi:5'-nucleotidase/UDP-sugar diphosphatase
MKRFSILAVLGLLFLGGAVPEKPPISLEILYTSDIHGHLAHDDATFLNPNFPPPLGGGATAAAFINKRRDLAQAAGRPVFLFDSGDLFQGTPLGINTKGVAIINWMNDMDYTAACLGNHDFDLGWQNADTLVKLANFPILGANILNAKTKKTVDWVDPSPVWLDAKGVKIAVLGYCTETTANMSFGKNIEGIEFEPVYEAMQKDVKKVRAEGADLVFVLMHAGLPYKPERDNEYRRMIDREKAGGLPHYGMNAMEIAHMIWGVDAIFGGHTHQGYDQPWEDPRTHTLVFEPYANGSSIGDVTMKIDPVTKTLVGYDTHADRGALITLFEDEIWPEQAQKEVIQAEVSKAEAGLDKVVGRTDVLLQRGSPNNALMGFVVADAYRTVLNADFAFQNTGGVRADISPGPITRRDLLTVSPFGNQMVLVNMKGSLLKAILEDKLTGQGGGIFISGGKVRYDLSRPDGDRIVDFTIGGQPFDPDKTYKVALTDYLAQGNSGMWRLRDQLGSEDILYTGYTDLDVLTKYVEEHSPLAPTNDARWVKITASS